MAVVASSAARPDALRASDRTRYSRRRKRPIFLSGRRPCAACSRLIASSTLRGGDLAQVHVSRGVTLIRFKADWDRAIADYDAALRLDPANVTAYAGRAGAYILKGDVDRAWPDVNEGLRLNPRHSGIRNVLGMYYH